MPLVTIAAVLIVLALLLLWAASRQGKASGLPSGRVVYADTNRWGKVEKPLYDETLRLTGKPDYLVSQGKALIPVEIKSGWAPEEPYPGHLYQLAAYCLLVEKQYAVRPPHGLIRYRNRTFAIDYTAALETHLRELIGEIRRDEVKRELARSHESSERCARCGYRQICDERL